MKKLIIILSLFTCYAQAGIIADTIYLEARGENQWGRRAVTTVIYNRAYIRQQSFEEVCLSRKQFSCWNNGYYKPSVVTAEQKKIMKECLQYEFQMLSGLFRPLDNWDHYHNIHVKPSWTNEMENVVVIGKQKFGRIE